MFKQIHFQTITLDFARTPRSRFGEEFASQKLSQENLINSDFYITGSVDLFKSPPITNYALSHLYHLQTFNIFHYGKSSFTERQNFQSFLILYTYGGHGSLNYRGKTWSLAEGDGALIDCREYHLYKTTVEFWDVAVLHLNGPLLPEFHQMYMQKQSPIFHIPLTGKLQYYLEQLLTFYARPHLYRDWQASTCIDNMLNHLLIVTSEEIRNKEIPQNIQYLMQYLESNYTKHITLDYLADFANMDKYYLAKKFKKYTGFSPNDYLISLRINQAKTLLKMTTLPAVKISHEIGIHDTNNFTKLFKKKTGMTPIQYRNANDGLL